MHEDVRPVRRWGSSRIRLVLVLAATTLAAACAPATAPEPGEVSPVAGLATQAPAEPGSAAFTATTLDGEVFESSILDPPLVLWFWAPWCTICQAEGPILAEVAAEFDGEVNFFGVAGLGTVEEMQTFVADTGTEALTHLVDDDGSIWQRFGVAATPSHILVDRAGEVDVEAGWIRPADLRAKVEALLD
jgi:thiol-disulfide isomerase/thioredoxin